MNCSTEHTDKNAKQNVPHYFPRTVDIVPGFSLPSNAKRKQCNCTAGHSEVSFSPEKNYAEGPSVPHSGPSGDASLLELAVFLNFLLEVCHVAQVLPKWRYQELGGCLGKDVLQCIEFCSYLNPFLSSVAWSNAFWCSWKTPVELDEFCRPGSVTWQVSSTHARKNGKC